MQAAVGKPHDYGLPAGPRRIAMAYANERMFILPCTEPESRPLDPFLRSHTASDRIREPSFIIKSAAAFGAKAENAGRISFPEEV